MIIRGYRPNNLTNFSSSKKLEDNKLSFQGTKFKVIEKSPLKKAIPIAAFLSSTIGALGYFLGGAGLLYDIYDDKKHNRPKIKTKKGDGVKTVTANTKLGQIGMNCAKVGIAASSVANIACGVGEGIPLMALGEFPNLAAANIIETPIGTGLFGIGIASIFAGLALDNTPNLKLNSLDLMAEKGFVNKTKLILNNMGNAAKETASSMLDLVKNIPHPSFYKENFLELTPKSLVLIESVNKDGKVILGKVLRNRKNYLMHAASFVLTMGGVGIIITSILNKKKAQEASLKTEEGGFLFDNFGITKYGIDRLSTGNKTAGGSFIFGGIFNAISQFVGLDNKDGRALQWLGIAGVFFGYAIDRGKHLANELSKSKARAELTRVVREWTIDLSKLITDSKELKKLQKEIKLQGDAFIAGKEGEDIPKITNEKFLQFENQLREEMEKASLRPETEIEKIFESMHLDVKRSDIINTKKAQEILTICSKKIFGEKPIEVIENKK